MKNICRDAASVHIPTGRPCVCDGAVGCGGDKKKVQLSGQTQGRLKKIWDFAEAEGYRYFFYKGRVMLTVHLQRMQASEKTHQGMDKQHPFMQLPANVIAHPLRR